MIGKLRKKFIIFTMSLVLILLTLVLGSVNVMNFVQYNQRADDILKYLLEDGFSSQRNLPPKGIEEEPRQEPPENMEAEKGVPPKRKEEQAREFPDFNPESRYKTRYFTVIVNNQGDCVEVNTRNIAAISANEAKKIGKKIWESGKISGYEGIYKYRTRVTVTPQGNQEVKIVFLDCNEEQQFARKVLVLSLIVGIVSYLLLFVLCVILSKKAVKPVIENIRMQKQFISDAGHELKTPIAIISANTDVLQMMGQENQWTMSIKNQTKRMTELVEEMLQLTRMEEKKEAKSMEHFSFSQLLEEMEQSFGVIARQKEKKLIRMGDGTQGEQNPGGTEPMLVYGDRTELRRMLSVLLDNAIKYSFPEDEITMEVKKSSRELKIIISNHCQEIKKDELSKMFERFYRVDDSRAREQGGFGLGLSIAREAVLLHHGSIRATYDSPSSKISFIICLPIVKNS